MAIDISKYQNIVVLTGAGISVASGLPAFRGPGGIWEEFNVEEYGHIKAFSERPQETWKLFGAMRTQVLNAQPNPAHIALARWEAKLLSDQQFLLVTQNVDGLHQLAGSRNVVELHGNIGRTKCSNEACDLQPFSDKESHIDKVPNCPKCGHPLRPDIILFGEMIPALADWQSKKALRDCDLFIAIGTSGSVSPASNFVRSAAYARAHTILINLESMDHGESAFQEVHLGKAEEILPLLLGAD